MSESFSAVREQYLRRHENPVNGALRTVEDVVGMIAESSGRAPSLRQHGGRAKHRQVPHKHQD